ncbi:MAG: CAP domain-containing protein [Ruminococcus sp.]|nr:CAP domain-containing protein [Ruminococcus sp.]
MKKSKKHFRSVISFLIVLTLLFSCTAFSASATSPVSNIKGDVDCNGRVTSADSLMVQRYAAGLLNLNNNQIQNADVNLDGKVTAMDAAIISRYVAGLDSFPDVDPFVAEVVRLVNIERTKAKLSVFKLDVELCNYANTRSQETVTFFSHTRPDGRAWHSILSDNKYSFRAAGENIAAGQVTPEEVVESWMNSPGHRANILNPKFSKLGVGYTYKSGTTYGHYWAQLFAG